MNHDRSLEIYKLVDLLWNDTSEKWYPEEHWERLLADACGTDSDLRAQVIAFARTSIAQDCESELALPIPAEQNTEGQPEEIGGHKIVSLIGKGGMGSVYEALFQGEGMEPRSVALKVVSERENSQIIVRRLRAEINLLSRLDHPNVVKILNAGTTPNGVPYFTMEMVEGGRSVKQYSEEQGLSIEARARLVQKICDVVAYVHSRNIVHRDLKPSNILVSSTGEPKLLDFGLSAFISPVEGAPSAVNSEVTPRRLGTPGFMSPNQANGGAPRPQDDLFALGAILQLLVTDSEDNSTGATRLRSALLAVARDCQAESPTENLVSPQQLKEVIGETLAGANAGLTARIVRIATTRTVVVVAALLVFGLALGSVYLFQQREKARQSKSAELAKVLRDIKQKEAQWQEAVNKLGSELWSPMLVGLTKRSGSFPKQVDYSMRLAEAGDSTAKGMLGFTLILCRGATLQMQREFSEKPRKDRYPPEPSRELLRLGVKQTPEDKEEFVDNLIKLEMNVTNGILETCSAENVDRAIEWFKELNAEGQAGAAAMLAEIFIQGLGGLEKQPRQAFEWANKSIKGGHPHGYSVLARLYAAGDGVPTNLDLAIDNWQAAAKHGDIPSQYNLAVLLTEGKNPKLGKDLVGAYTLAVLAKSGNQNLLVGTTNRIESRYWDFHLNTKAKAAKLVALLQEVLSPAERAVGEQAASEWRPLRFNASTSKFTIQQHEVIRKAVLGDEPQAK